jgi:uncharacterized protein (TIGR02147 family)
MSDFKSSTVELIVVVIIRKPEGNTMQKPVIFDYIDYRQFLEAIYKYFKSEKPAFSYRFIAQYTGASSSGWFPNIIRGRINLTRNYIVKLAQLIDLSARETEYFEILIDYNQAGNFEEKSILLEQLRVIRGIRPVLLKQEHLAFLSKWYISAIRELFFILKFRNDYKTLAEMILPNLQIAEVEDAVSILQSIGLIKKDNMGYFHPCDSIIKKDPSIKTDLWTIYMKSKIALGLDAIDRYPKGERDFSEVYMSLSEKGFEEACQEIEKLRKKLLIISDRDKNRNRVFQCAIQLFPLSRKVNN